MSPDSRGGEVTTRELIGIAFALRIALLRGSFRARGGSARIVSLVIGSLFSLFLSGALLAGLVAARGHGDVGPDAAVLLYNVLLLGWVVLPVLTFMTDDLLDPAKLALLPLTGRQRVVLMGFGSLVGVGPAFTLLVALGLVLTVERPVAVPLALLAAVLQVALCLTLSRTCVALLSGALRSRRGRDLGVLLVLLVGLSFQLVNVGVQLLLHDSNLRGAADLKALAGPLRWTPAGWLAAVPALSALPALGVLALVAALVVALVLVWGRLVDRAAERVDLTTQARPKARRAGRTRGRLPAPRGRTGAVVVKELHYYARDPRRMTTLAYALLLPVVLGVPITVTNGGPGPGLVYLVVMVGLLAGTTNGNRFGMEGSAVHLLIVTWTDRRDPRRDLAGGDLAVAVVLVPFIAVAGVVAAVLSDDWWHLPSALGLTLAIFGVGLGASSLQTVVAAWPVPQTASAFGGGGGSGAGFQAAGASMLVLFGEAASALPLLGLLIPALVLHSMAWSVALLVVGPLYGALIGEGLRRLAAARWFATGPEVLQTVSAVG